VEVKSANLPNVAINPTVMQIALAIGIVALTYMVAMILVFILGRLSERFPARRLFFKRLQPIPQIGVYVFAGYVLIKIFSPEQSSLYAILGSMALALELAAQNLLRDVIGGIVVLTNKPFQIGDRIHASNHYGEVTSIGLWSTKLLTPANVLVTIPNSKILTDGVSSINAGAVDCLVTTHLYLSGEPDFTLINQLARDAALTSKLVYLSKPITVLTKDEGRGILIEIRASVFDMRYEELFAADLTRRIKKALAMRTKPKSEPLDAPKSELKPESLDDKINAALAEHLMALGRQFAHPNGSSGRDIVRGMRL
jgi:small-conductance mechanosensitive channel